MEWLRLFTLLSAEIYWQFSNLSLFLLSVGKSTHAEIIWSGRWIGSSYQFFKILLVTIVFFLMNIIQKRSSASFWLFQRLIIDKFDKSFTNCVYGKLKMMKCLLCNFQPNDFEDVKKHCIDFHNLDRNDHFFIKLFKKQDNVFHGKKCLRCNEFLTSSWFKVNHDFLAHYNDSKNMFEDKPVNYTNLGKIQKYQVTFAKHSHDEDFYSSENLVDNFCLMLRT